MGTKARSRNNTDCQRYNLGSSFKTIFPFLHQTYVYAGFVDKPGEDRRRTSFPLTVAVARAAFLFCHKSTRTQGTVKQHPSIHPSIVCSCMGFFAGASPTWCTLDKSPAHCRALTDGRGRHAHQEQWSCSRTLPRAVQLSPEIWTSDLPITSRLALPIKQRNNVTLTPLQSRLGLSVLLTGQQSASTERFPAASARHRRKNTVIRVSLHVGVDLSWR